jgi:hypothetical protein
MITGREGKRIEGVLRTGDTFLAKGVHILDTFLDFHLLATLFIPLASLTPSQDWIGFIFRYHVLPPHSEKSRFLGRREGPLVLCYLGLFLCKDIGHY